MAQQSMSLSLMYVSITMHLVSSSQLPIMPGSITSMPRTSSKMYAPNSMSRSRYAADGPDSFIVIDSSAVALISGGGDNYTVEHLAGHTALVGYVDDVGRDARFDHIGDFAQSEDGTYLYITDQKNHCVRLYDRDTGNVTTFAGSCTEIGFSTGPREAARFYEPAGIAISKDWSELYVADRQNNRILRITGIQLLANESWVQTVVDNSFDVASQVILPVGLALNSDNSLLYVTTEVGIVTFTNFSSGTSNPEKRFISKTVHDGLDVVLSNDDKYAIVADLQANRLVFIDLVNGGEAQFCSGSLTDRLNRIDGTSDVCELNSPQGLAIIDDTHIFITEHSSEAIRRITYQPKDLLTTTTEEPPSTTTIPTTAMPTEVLSVKSTTEPISTTFPKPYDGRGASTERSRQADEDPLVLGLTVGLIVPIVLISLLVGFVCYVMKERKKQMKEMYARRTEQGGYENQFSAGFDRHSTSASYRSYIQSNESLGAHSNPMHTADQSQQPIHHYLS